MRPLQDQDSSFSVRKNEVKSNLIAITEISLVTRTTLGKKRNDVQDCSQAAMCDVLRLLAPPRQ